MNDHAAAGNLSTDEFGLHRDCRSAAMSVGLNKSEFVLQQALACLRQGDAADGERILRQRLFEQPTDVEALALLGDIVSSQGRTLEASVLLKRALSVSPGAQKIRLALAHLLEKLGHYHASLKTLEEVQGPLRVGFEARALEAALLGHLGLHDRELSVYAAMAGDYPRNAVVWMAYSNAFKAVGRTEDAINALRRAIKVRPTYGEAYWCLANLKTFRFENRDLAAMRKALRGKLDEADALHLHFALGKALEDRGEVEASFRHYAAGNRIRAAQLTPAQMGVSPRVDATIATFDKEFFSRASAAGGDEARDPIFIVGLQRSGSTLVEQILASHPMIEGTSELMLLEYIWARLAGTEGAPRDPFAEVAKLDSDQLKALGAEYLERTRPFRLTDRPMFIDKLPANWLNIGFIRLILPNAKIVDARRHPMACGFSNFRQCYAAGVTFSYGLEAIGRFYCDYLRTMNHFDQVLPGAVHHVINERLIEDPEGEIRRLLNYVGVPFHPACLEFHRNKRAVHSASAEQVRRPINRDGVDSWRRYEPWLEPLKRTLGSALEEWDRLPLSELSGDQS